MVPQPTWALTEFVKHIADPLVDKGWNLHLKFGKGDPKRKNLYKEPHHQRPQLKLWTKKKSVVPQGRSEFH